MYRFDFSEEGVGRRTGHITLVGISLEEFTLGLPTPAAPARSDDDGNPPNLIH